MQVILLGAQIPAQEAKTHGLVAEVSPNGQALTTAVSAASQLASKSTVALALAKEAIARSESKEEGEKRPCFLFFFFFFSFPLDTSFLFPFHFE
jgi:enoyl-CoA hydratase/carnithine racemase